MEPSSLFDRIFTILHQFINGMDVPYGKGLIKWIRWFFDLIVENPVLILFCIALPLVGLGIGLIRRLVSIRA